ncbi:MAG: hypothetical protein IJI37_00100 [Opitutales bacterium]|nr:hypothetical protein [Opitutales bacterium]
MKDIAIFGAGGFGKEVACFINLINESKSGQMWNFIGFFDDDKTKIGSDISRYGKVLGTTETLNAWDKELDLVVAIGNPNSIKNVVQKIKIRISTSPISATRRVSHLTILIRSARAT